MPRTTNLLYFEMCGRQVKVINDRTILTDVLGMFEEKYICIHMYVYYVTVIECLFFTEWTDQRHCPCFLYIYNSVSVLYGL